MAGGRLGQGILAGAGWAGAVGLALTFEPLARRGAVSPAGAEHFRDLWAWVADPHTQWMISVTLALYLAGFGVIAWRMQARKAVRWRDGWLWLTLALLWGGVSYVRSYREAGGAVGYVAWLAGAALGWGMWWWVGGGWQRPRLGRGLYLLGLLVGWLAFLGTRTSPEGSPIRYRDVERWSGFWGHPNEAGLLMGLGLDLARGRAPFMVWQGRTGGFRGNRTERLSVAGGAMWLAGVGFAGNGRGDPGTANRARAVGN